MDKGARHFIKHQLRIKTLPLWVLTLGVIHVVVIAVLSAFVWVSVDGIC